MRYKPVSEFTKEQIGGFLTCVGLSNLRVEDAGFFINELVKAYLAGDDMTKDRIKDRMILGIKSPSLEMRNRSERWIAELMKQTPAWRMRREVKAVLQEMRDELVLTREEHFRTTVAMTEAEARLRALALLRKPRQSKSERKMAASI